MEHSEIFHVSEQILDTKRVDKLSVTFSMSRRERVQTKCYSYIELKDTQNCVPLVETDDAIGLNCIWEKNSKKPILQKR